MLDQLTYETINPLVGSTFRLTATDGQIIDLTLTSAGKVMESEAAQLTRTAFSLFFSGPPAPHLPQGTYPMRHEVFGDEAEQIFLVPVARNQSGFVYEAVFT
jgi:hypothetical protein